MKDYYPIKIDHDVSKVDWGNGLFMFMLHVTRTPPHIGLIYNSRVFDINIRGKRLGVDVQSFINVIKARSIKSIFFEFNHSSKKRIQETIVENITSFDQANLNASCLAPVKQVITSLYNNEAQNAPTILQLLPILKEEQIIKETYHYGLVSDIVDNVFRLKRYTIDDVNAEIHRLNTNVVTNE